MLALPLQGFAAASMLFCGMGASQGGGTQQLVLIADHHHMGGVKGTQYDHSTPAKTVEAAKQSPDMQKQLPDATHKCGVCASCCSVVAILSFPATVELQSLPKADLAEPFVLIYAVPSRLPEKPPRA